MRHLLFLLFLISPCILFASPTDSVKQDTITLPDSLIQTIGIKCTSVSTILFNKDLQQPRCINSQGEFNDFFNSDCDAVSDIDFDKETLLWFPTSSSPVEYKRTIKTIGDKVIYNVDLIGDGGPNLAMLVFCTNSIVIPKINSNSTVIFTIDWH